MLGANAQAGSSGTEAASHLAHKFGLNPEHPPAERAPQKNPAVNEPDDKLDRESRAPKEAEGIKPDPIPAPTASGLQLTPHSATAAPVQCKSDTDSPPDAFEREADELSARVMRKAESFEAGTASADGQEAQEVEADRAADEVVGRLDHTRPGQRVSRPAAKAPASRMGGLGDGRPLSPDLRSRFERAFGWDFSRVRLHAGPAAAGIAARLGARAFTHGTDVVFGNKVSNPEASDQRRLLAHELTHVVQQGMGAGAKPALISSSLSAAQPARVQAAPLVTNVATSAAELGVGGRDIRATATVTGRRTNVTWSINPGGVVPAGVTVVGTGRRVRIRSAQPGGGAVIGGPSIVIRAAVTGTAADFADSAPVRLVQVVSATYANNPPLANIASAIPGVFPPNTGEPNRDGITGNTVAVNAVTAPVGRPVRVAFRRSLGARVAGNIITPGRTTGIMRLRITDTATRARLDEAAPSAAGGAPLMADLRINSVPTRANSLTRLRPLGPYGAQNQFGWQASDPSGAGGRVIGELMSLRENTLGMQLAGPTGWNPPIGFNPTVPNLGTLSVPANQWRDQVVTPAGSLTPGGIAAIDVNRFTGPGVPHLPRRFTAGQAFVYFSWAGAGTIFSRVFDRGIQRRSLRGTGATGFTTEHRFPHARTTFPEPYLGNPLIVLSAVAVNPTAAGATGLAADGTATANLAVNSSVAGRSVNWTVLSGDSAVTAGNPAALPALATLRAGVRAGTFRLRAADTLHPNRRAAGRFRVLPVRIRNLRATPSTVPVGALTSNVAVRAEPGGRTLNWTVDAAAAAAGVTVAPVVTGPGLAMNVTVTRPAGFTGRVTVTATDSVLPARSGRVRIRFR